MFKFIHAADIHLDSPLRGLERYEGAPVDRIRQASRRAFENLVCLAIEEQVAFVLLAGDLYDGDWKDYNTGLFMVAQMAKLREAGIRVYVIAGNHDAANKMTRKLPLPANVSCLSCDEAQTILDEDLGVAVHGQGFATQAVTKDLSQHYPGAVPGLFNIGLLHTCAAGAEGHEPYAPCTVPGLCSKGYDYWALGHVHQRNVLCETPLVVFPGNLQGRHIREAGPKGCVLVTVDDHGQPGTDFRELDVLRWEECRVDASTAAGEDDLLTRFAESLAELRQRCPDHLLAVRVVIAGATPLHDRIAARQQHWVNQIRGCALHEAAGDVWVEKVRLKTGMPRESGRSAALDGPVGELLGYLDELRASPDVWADLRGEFDDLLKKLPAEIVASSPPVRFDEDAWRHETLEHVRQMLLARLFAGETTA